MPVYSWDPVLLHEVLSVAAAVGNNNSSACTVTELTDIAVTVPIYVARVGERSIQLQITILETILESS